MSCRERGEMEKFSTTGMRPAKALLRARALLLLDAGPSGPGWTLRRVSVAVGLSTRALKGLKARFHAEGLGAVTRKPRSTTSRPAVLDGAPGARLAALMREKPPDGHARWTLRLLRDALVNEQAVASVSLPTIGKWLRDAGVVL